MPEVDRRWNESRGEGVDQTQNKLIGTTELKVKEKANLQKCRIREIEILLILFKVCIF